MNSSCPATLKYCREIGLVFLFPSIHALKHRIREIDTNVNHFAICGFPAMW
eukprot:m.200414 g.200414  ORF g.200414 m.200414 type:complete len:51 (+) comp18791_c0_seq7:999-1151(+)